MHWMPSPGWAAGEQVAEPQGGREVREQPGGGLCPTGHLHLAHSSVLWPSPGAGRARRQRETELVASPAPAGVQEAGVRAGVSEQCPRQGTCKEEVPETGLESKKEATSPED